MAGRADQQSSTCFVPCLLTNGKGLGQTKSQSADLSQSTDYMGMCNVECTSKGWNLRFAQGGESPLSMLTPGLVKQRTRSGKGYTSDIYS